MRTKRIYGTRQLNGSNYRTVMHDISMALVNIIQTAKDEGRHVLWDTLEIKTERLTTDDWMLTEATPRITSRTVIEASAECVEFPETETPE